MDKQGILCWQKYQQSENVTFQRFINPESQFHYSTDVYISPSQRASLHTMPSKTIIHTSIYDWYRKGYRYREKEQIGNEKKPFAKLNVEIEALKHWLVITATEYTYIHVYVYVIVRRNFHLLTETPIKLFTVLNFIETPQKFFVQKKI